METDGALADITAQHEQEVQNHSESRTTIATSIAAHTLGL